VKLKVKINVCSIDAGETEWDVTPGKGIIGKMLAGDLAGALASTQDMVDELNQIPGVKASCNSKEAQHELDSDDHA